MNLLGVLRTGVKIADKVTKSVQATVTYARFASGDAFGTVTPAASVELRAVVDRTMKRMPTSSGVLVVVRATVLFLDIAALVAATGGEGIGDKDTITLPDGTTGPILDVKGFVDAGTGKPIATEVMLG